MEGCMGGERPSEGMMGCVRHLLEVLQAIHMLSHLRGALQLLARALASVSPAVAHNPTEQCHGE